MSGPPAGHCGLNSNVWHSHPMKSPFPICALSSLLLAGCVPMSAADISQEGILAAHERRLVALELVEMARTPEGIELLNEMGATISFDLGAADIDAAHGASRIEVYLLPASLEWESARYTLTRTGADEGTKEMLATSGLIRRAVQNEASLYTFQDVPDGTYGLLGSWTTHDPSGPSRQSYYGVADVLEGTWMAPPLERVTARDFIPGPAR